MTRNIHIDEVTRVEGHGAIDVVLEGSQVKSVKMNIFEGPRFFESLLKTQLYEKVPDITRRICAICTASHSLASIGAIEDAFQVKNTPQTELLRDLLIHGEMIESHALHVFMLALPDFLGYPDAIAMTDKYLDTVKMALECKKAGNLIHSTLSGRDVHGMNERVGGFSKVPSEDDLLAVKALLTKVKPAGELGVKLFSSFDLHDYNESDNFLMAIDPGKRFGFLGDHILTSDGNRYPQKEYQALTNESVVQHSYAKHSRYHSKPFMVGAIPRIILSHKTLEGTAKDLYNEHKDLITSKNTLSNNLGQAIELVHSIERGIQNIDDLLSNGLEDESIVDFDVYKSRGVNAVEAPRGLLYHDYTFDDKGQIVKANIITPTAQNVYNMEKDIRVTAGNLAEKTDNEIKSALELVVRAYDPCISCSVHVARIK